MIAPSQITVVISTYCRTTGFSSSALARVMRGT